MEGTHRFFHLPTLYQEIAAFWSCQKTPGYDWFAQFFMVLALGCRALDSKVRLTLDSPSIGTFVSLARMCLEKADYASKANNNIIRSLCLMAIAVQTSSYSCRNIDSSGAWLNIAVGHCLRLGHHEASHSDSSTTCFDAYLASRVWTTAAYLQLQQSMNSGTAALLQPSNFEKRGPLANLDDEDVRPSHCHCSWLVSRTPQGASFTGGTYQALLSESLPAAAEIVHAANSIGGDSPKLSYATTMQHDAVFHRLLSVTARVYDSAGSTSNSRTSLWKQNQRLLLDTFFRRMLLILHQPFAQCLRTQVPAGCLTDGTLSSQFPLSHWSILKCSLGILVTQRRMLEDAHAGHSQPSGATTANHLYEVLLKQDFFIAALLAGMEIDADATRVQQGSQLSPATPLKLTDAMDFGRAVSDPNILAVKDTSGGKHPLPAVSDPRIPPPRETIIQTLRCCRAIWAQSLGRNPENSCDIWVYLVLNKMVDTMTAMPGGLADKEP